MPGVLLDRRSGRRVAPPELLGPSGLPIRAEKNIEAGWYMPELGEKVEQIAPDFSKLPQHILDRLEQSRTADFSKASPFLASQQGWSQVEGVISNDGAALTAAAEALMIPDFLLAIPRPGQSMASVTYTVRLFGDLSMAVTTPGNFILRLRYGGLAGVLLATSATVAPTGTQVITTASFELYYLVTVRSVPTVTTATSWTQGRWDCPGTLETTPASTTILVTHLKARMIPPTGPAVSPSMDVSVSKALSPTYQPSLTTASCTTHLALIESRN